MPRFAANLTYLFTELPFLDRFEAAAKAGFAAVEILFPYDQRIADLKARLAELRPGARPDQHVPRGCHAR